MTLLGSCNILNDSNTRCNRTFRLHNLIFRDPFSLTKPDLIGVCDTHYRYLILELNEHIDEYRRALENTRYKIATLREAGRKNDVFYDTSVMKSKLENLKRLINKSISNECKNIFCKNDLSKLDKDTKLYSVTSFNPSGKRHYTFYFCSLRCFNIMKGKCGMLNMITHAQRTL